MKLKVDVVVFDYGNTLILDPFDKIMLLKGEEFQKAIEGFGYAFERKDIVRKWSEANLEVEYPFISHFSQEIPIIIHALKKLGVRKYERKIAKKLLEIYRDGFKIILKRDKRLDKVKKILQELKDRGKRILVFTNDRKETARSVFEWSGLINYIERLIVSEAIGIEKPDLRVFEYVTNVSKCPKERIVYVGDDPKKDIEPSKAFGMKAIWLKNPESLSSPWRDYRAKIKQNPDFIISNLSEILNIIE
jgi:HAD superfamily hydrolase (TIGR01549 family)